MRGVAYFYGSFTSANPRGRAPKFHFFVTQTQTCDLFAVANILVIAGLLSVSLCDTSVGFRLIKIKIDRLID